MKRIFNILAWLLAAAYLTLVLGFVRSEYEELTCRDIEVRIEDSLEVRFLNDKRIRELIMQRHPSPRDTPLSQMNAGLIEEMLLAEQAVKDAQVYKTVSGRLVVEISQRDPVIRVQDRDQEVYYLDREGNVIPSVKGYSPYIMLASGYIDAKYAKEQNVMSPGVHNTEQGTMRGLLDLACFINDDPFWKSQILQIYVDRDGQFELIPRVGSHIIHFGTSHQMDDKFFKLKTLYHEGFSHTGWNQYEIINLKYDRQVVCTKR